MTDLNEPQEPADVVTETNRQDDWWATQEKFGAPLTPEEQTQVDELHKELKQNAQLKYAPKTPADVIHDSVDASEREKSFIERASDAIMHRQRVTAAKTRDAEQAELYKEKLDMGLLVGSGVKPNLKEISKHFVKHVEKLGTEMHEIGKTAQKTTTAFREIGGKVGKVKKAFLSRT